MQYLEKNCQKGGDASITWLRHKPTLRQDLTPDNMYRGQPVASEPVLAAHWSWGALLGCNQSSSVPPEHGFWDTAAGSMESSSISSKQRSWQSLAHSIQAHISLLFPLTFPPIAATSHTAHKHLLSHCHISCLLLKSLIRACKSFYSFFSPLIACVANLKGN